MKNTILSILISLVLTTSIFANSVYYVATTGTTNASGSFDNPCRFVDQAYYLACSSSVASIVHILPGVYSNDVTCGSDKIIIRGCGDLSKLLGKITVTSNF